MKEITYNNKISTVEEIYKKIENIKGASSFTIDGYKIYIKGIEKKNEDGTTTTTDDVTLYVLDKDIFTNSVTKTITAFIDKDTYEAYLNDTQNKIEGNDTGTIIENLYIQNTITIKKDRIPAGDKIYETEEELSKFLLFGTTDEQETYIVKAGDTIEEISNNNKLSTEEFLIANTNFKTAQDLLYPGQEVKLGLISPKFDLVEVEHVVSQKPIKMETIYKDDDTQYVGYEKVEQDGKDGLALVTEKIQLVNGEKDWVYGVKYQGRQLAAGEKIPLGASLTLMVGDGSGDMSEEEDSVDVSVDTEKPVTSESSPAQDDSWF